MEPLKEITKPNKTFIQHPVISLKIAISSNKNCRVLKGKSLRATVSIKNDGSSHNSEYHSEVEKVISNSTTFQTRFKVPFDFLSCQDFQISLEEVQDPNNPIKMFTTSFRLGNVLNSPSCELSWPITVGGEKLNPTNSVLYLKTIRHSDNDVLYKVRFNGIQLTNFGTFSSIKPQLKILRPKNLKTSHASSEIESWEEVYTSNRHKNSNCQFRSMVVPLSNLCAGNRENPIKINLYNRKSKDKQKLKGEAITTAQMLLTQGSHFKVINSKRKKEAGAIVVEKVQKEIIYDSLDYLLSGLDIVQSYALDFTKSNQDVNQSNSLHYISPMKLNSYQRCFRNFQRVLSQYTQKLRIGGFGFGAVVKYPNFRSEVSHFFPLSGDKQTEYASNSEEFEESYLKALKNIELNGPTLFEPQLKEIIKSVHSDAKQDDMSYRIHFILIDGTIFDIQETKDLLVQASSLPFSLIVIGIGNFDFKEMEVFNQPKEEFVASNGDISSRANTRFFKFNDLKDLNDGLMAKEVLDTIPFQICEYYRISKKIPSTGMGVKNSTIIGMMDYQSDHESEEEEEEKDLKIQFFIPKGKQTEVEKSSDSDQKIEDTEQKVQIVEVQQEAGQTIKVIQVVEGQEPTDLPENAMVFRVEGEDAEEQEKLIQQKLKELQLAGGENSNIQIIKQEDLQGENLESHIRKQLEDEE